MAPMFEQGVEMRTFIRHPSDVPLEVESENVAQRTEEHISNVSVGGVAFKSNTPLPENTVIKLRIPLVRPTFEARARIVWCRPEEQHYDIGAEFLETRDGFRIRMVEQICHIEQYKKEVYEKEGRSLSGRDAALEWIGKYAGSFQNEVYEKIEK